MSTTASPMSGLGPARAKAWLVTVINPVLENLDVQELWLNRSRWTWRPLTDDFDAFGRVRVYVAPRYRPNLDDVRESKPEVGPKLDNYDAALDGLGKALNACHRRLTEDAEFVDACLRTQRRPDKLKPEQRAAVVRDLATLVVDNADPQDSDLAGPYAGVWSKSAAHLSGIARQRAEPQFLDVEHWGRTLKAASGDLRQALERLRREIVQTYGLPPVPVD